MAFADFFSPYSINIPFMVHYQLPPWGHVSRVGKAQGNQGTFPDLRTPQGSVSHDGKFNCKKGEEVMPRGKTLGSWPISTGASLDSDDGDRLGSSSA